MQAPICDDCHCCHCLQQHTTTTEVGSSLQQHGMCHFDQAVPQLVSKLRSRDRYARCAVCLVHTWSPVTQAAGKMHLGLCCPWRYPAAPPLLLALKRICVGRVPAAPQLVDQSWLAADQYCCHVCPPCRLPLACHPSCSRDKTPAMFPAHYTIYTVFRTAVKQLYVV